MQGHSFVGTISTKKKPINQRLEANLIVMMIIFTVYLCDD